MYKGTDIIMNRYIDLMNHEFPNSMSLYSVDKVVHNVGTYEFTLRTVVNIPTTEIARHTRIQYELIVLHTGKPWVCLNLASIETLLVYVQELIKAESHKNTAETDFHNSIKFNMWNKDE